ncbi:hypothetical protein RRG08_020678 [Elysia crispata]|uniref:Uncharacterized protein n=1 Tax=Elysia crispata TaxID=231223 RepID=A0AAE1D9M0_9GAST|nr:hypothetical protein RRG08_020678 [Elysia crispata]
MFESNTFKSRPCRLPGSLAHYELKMVRDRIGEGVSSSRTFRVELWSSRVGEPGLCTPTQAFRHRLLPPHPHTQELQAAAELMSIAKPKPISCTGQFAGPNDDHSAPRHGHFFCRPHLAGRAYHAMVEADSGRRVQPISPTDDQFLGHAMSREDCMVQGKLEPDPFWERLPGYTCHSNEGGN